MIFLENLTLEDGTETSVTNCQHPKTTKNS